MKCLSCEAELKFDAKLQKLKCEYCGSTFDPEEFDRKDKFAKETKNTVDGIEAKNYSCTQCGATILTFDDTAVTFCSYCSSSNIIEQQLYKEEKPDYIIPFEITQEQCEKIYKEKISKNFFAPKYMKEDVTIKKFRGIYMPYAVYNSKFHGHQKNKGEKYVRSRGDYDIYDVYSIDAKIDAEYTGISYDISSNFYDRFSNAIAPFDFTKAKKFNTKYLSGFYADSKDVSKELYVKESENIANNFATMELAKIKDYKKYGCYAPKVSLKTPNIYTAYYPVYFLAIRNNKKGTINYAVVNGQTGKIAVEMPIDKSKFIIFTLLIAIPIYLILNLFLVLTPQVLAILGGLFALVTMFISIAQGTSLYNKEHFLDDKGYSEVRLSKQQKNELKKSKKKTNIFLPIICFIIDLLVLINNPVNDIVYYETTISVLVIMLLSFNRLIKQYNKIATTKLSQLGIRGGDEHE